VYPFSNIRQLQQDLKAGTISCQNLTEQAILSIAQKKPDKQEVAW
jgi:hypothetical protein